MSNTSTQKDYTVSASGRRFFTETRSSLEMPNLIEMQRDSYDWFIKEIEICSIF